MKYVAYIYSLNQSTINQSSISPNFIIGYDSSADLFIKSVTFKSSFISMSAPGTLVIKGYQWVSSRLNRYILTTEIQSGDLILIFEENVLVYTGYILEVLDEFDAEEGINVILNFDTLLSHFSRQNMIQSFSDVQTLTPKGVAIQSDFFYGKTTISDLLLFLQQESIYNFASKLPANGGQESYSVVYTNSDWLSSTTQIYYYPNVQSTKEEVLLSSLFLYQVMVYQDYDGSIIVGLPSAKNTSTFQISTTDRVFLRKVRRDAQALMVNNVVEALGYFGWFPTVGNPLGSLATPNSQYFPRSSFLYTSQFFSQVALHVDNFQNGMLTDPALLTLATKVLNFGVNITTPNNMTNPNTIIGLLSARYLAQYLAQSEGIVITLQRSMDYTDIPINKVISLDGVQYYCIEAVVEFDSISNTEAKNTITLVGVPINSITGAWGT